MSGHTDREMLELAAKAAGISGFYSADWGTFLVDGQDDNWEPLTNDGDAFRLAVQLDIQVWRRSGGRVEGIHAGSVLTNSQAEPLLPDPYAATRRAIVRAAANIGEAM